MKKAKIINLLIGICLFFLPELLLPREIFTSSAARYSIGCVLWMAYWWITSPVDLAVTAFIPIVVNAFFNVTDSSSVLSQYANDTIILILGASIVSASWEDSGLNRRIAITFMNFAGNSLRAQVIFWFLLSTCMSMVLANVAVAAALTPLAVSILGAGSSDDRNVGKTMSGSFVLMAIAWGAGLGGLASPLGGAMNLVVINYLEQVSGQEYMYIDWVVRFLPIMLVLILSNVLYLYFAVPKNKKILNAVDNEHLMIKSQPKMSFAEKCGLVLFSAAVILTFARPLYDQLLPGLKPAYIYVFAGVLSFLIPDGKGEAISDWTTVEKRINWGILYIIAGGLAAAQMLSDTGADAMLGKVIFNAGLDNKLVLITLFVTLPLIMSDITSNTATAAVFMPIVVTVTSSLGLNPIPYIYMATIGVNLSYSLPTSVRAIPIGYGMPPKLMLKHGLKLSLIVIVLLVPLCYVLLEYWPLFLTV